jgi:MoaA/NifB/PqqE/SkfB family radical SAM enzyme
MKKNLKTLETLATRRLVLIFDKVDFTYTSLSWRRLWNWFLAELSCLLKPERVWAYPTHLQIEPVSGCNLRCPLCYISTQNIPQGFLKLDDFRKLIEEVGDHILFLHFWGWGEPFLNKDIFPMIRFAKEKGIKIITSTNGHFFEKEENVDRLIDSELDVLIFALDGVDKETYEKYRQKGDFDKALRGLRLLLRRREERGAALPRLNLRMVVTRDNEDQVSHMKSLAQEIGVDLLTLKTLCSHGNIAMWEELLPHNPGYRRYEYDDKGKPIRKKNPCKKMWNHPTVYHDGTVVACDYHTTQELSLGNVFANNGRGFGHVWFGKAFRQLRTRFLKGEYSGLRCENCSLNFVDVDRYVSHAFKFSKT